MLKNIPITDFMRRDPLSARPDMSLDELVVYLQAHAVRTVSVVKETGKLVGVVGEADLFIKERGVPFSMEKVPTLLGHIVAQDQVEETTLGKTVTVREVMTRDPIRLKSSATLQDVVWLMHKKRVSLLPVVDRGTLVGEVRRINVLRLIYGIPDPAPRD